MSESPAYPSILEDALARLRDGPEPDDFLTASHRLHALGAQAVPRLLAIVRDSQLHPGFRARAIEILTAIGWPDLQDLLSLASDPELQVRWTAISQLGKCGDVRALPTLEKIAATDGAEWAPQPGFSLRIRDAAAKAAAAVRQRAVRG